ncbi:MAG: hypothetical protein FJ087_14305 [Deltaproteobacteria bacterium]|nr:hypothetical protein [Deltaproteobacteria bacterium]
MSRATVVAVLLLAVAACSEGGSAGAPDVTADPGADAAEGAGDAAPEQMADVPAEAPPDWTLPPCYRACDRVVACGVGTCEAYDWSSAGVLFEACFGGCDEARAAGVLGATACGDVLDAARPWTPALAADACAASPCSLACRHLADCIASECPGHADTDPAAYAAGCETGCIPADAGWILSMPDCAALVGVIEQNDPVFAAECRGTSGTCPDAAACAAYGGKIAGCVSEHCGEPAAPFLAGIGQVIAHFCVHDKDCPSPEAVAVLNSPEQTCSSQALAGVGPAPPFDRACKGSPDVPFADLAAACARLFACGAGQYLPSEDACVVFLTFVADAPLRVACLVAAADCGPAWACLEGM